MLLFYISCHDHHIIKKDASLNEKRPLIMYEKN
ncbi:Uncharacterised protein [Segatella buccae]|uniref:Uncharacterized protein n=1 Tax=Segatella buccae TaxID=28126 RepID=A0AAQ1UHJ4_9BACT|nr:Uncharacterised protein [Segatella buccae]